MDIDADGVLSREDVTTFFGRHEYLSAVSGAAQQGETLVSPKKVIREGVLYPVTPLSELRLKEVLRDLAQRLFFKKMSLHEFFRLLDTNGDGLISIDEWKSNIDKVITLSPLVKDGLFAVIDSARIGVIDYNTFVNVLRSVTVVGGRAIEAAKIQRQGDEEADGEWTWTQSTLALIRSWYASENLSIEDAFRVFDADFDGKVSHSDLDRFLRDVLHLPHKEITSARVSKLFKLLDEFKRGAIELVDLKRLLTEDANANENFAVTGGRFFDGRSSFDWRANARQQLGIVISRKFSSLPQSFATIAVQREKLTFQQFAQWVRSSHALIGFEATEHELQAVFADLDPHKKGYLTERDWVLAFDGFNWRTQMLSEAQATIHAHFPPPEHRQQAYDFFCDSQKKVTQESFTRALKQLFGKRFTQQDISALWHDVVGTQTYLAERDFSLVLYTEAPEAAKVQQQRPQTAAARIATQTWQKAQHKTAEEIRSDEETQRIVRKVKQTLRASNRTMHEIFREFDKDGSGDISNLEFKDALRKLGIGLTSREIDHLVNYCDESGDGCVNWVEFVNKFALGESMQLIIQRARKLLKQINDYIHYYMLSPKDAFRLFNEDRSGRMTYKDFTRFMEKAFQMANETLPSFAIMRDIFQTIDIRQDGFIDLVEWSQTFRQFKPPDASMQGRPIIQAAQAQSANASPQHRRSSQTPVVNANAYFIESSKQYDDIMRAVARNRKFLLDVFGHTAKSKIITFDVVKDILMNLFRSLSIQLENDHYPLLIKFAERDGVVDYKFMLEVYKERQNRISVQPDALLLNRTARTLNAA